MVRDCALLVPLEQLRPSSMGLSPASIPMRPKPKAWDDRCSRVDRCMYRLNMKLDTKCLEIAEANPAPSFQNWGSPENVAQLSCGFPWNIHQNECDAQS